MAIPPVKILPDLIVDGRIVKRDIGGNEIIIASTSSLSSSVPIYAPNLTSSLTSSYALTAAYAENAGGGLTFVSSSGNITGSGTAADNIRLKDNITLTSVTASINGNVIGTASFASSASYALTASYATNANIDTGSFVSRNEVTGALGAYATLVGVSSSFITPAQFTSSVSNFPVRNEITGVLNTYATLAGVSSSFTTPSHVSSSITAALTNYPVRQEITGVLGNYATLGSNTFNGNQVITGNLDVLGTVTVNDLYITYVTSSVIFSSGSTKFGNTLDDTHQFTGSLFITGTVSADNFIGTASHSVSSSFAQTASYAENANVDLTLYAKKVEVTGALNNYATLTGVSASFVTPAQVTSSISNFPTRNEVTGVLAPYALLNQNNTFIGNQIISGSLYITASVTASNFVGTASYALTAAYAENSSGNITVAYNNLREILTGSFDIDGTKTIELQKFADTDMDFVTFDILTKPSGTNYYTNDLISFQISGNLNNKISIYLSSPAYNSNDRYKIIAVKETGSF